MIILTAVQVTSAVICFLCTLEATSLLKPPYRDQNKVIIIIIYKIVQMNMKWWHPPRKSLSLVLGYVQKETRKKPLNRRRNLVQYEVRVRRKCLCNQLMNFTWWLWPRSNDPESGARTRNRTHYHQGKTHLTVDNNSNPTIHNSTATIQISLVML